MREAAELQVENNLRNDIQTQAPLSPSTIDYEFGFGDNGIKTFDCQASFYSYQEPAVYLMPCYYPGNMYWA